MRLCLLALLCLQPLTLAAAQKPALPSPPAAFATPDAALRYVIVLSRHGVRSPTGKAAQYGAYSAATWPQWPVAPGDLTPHGFQLMQKMGSDYRAQFAAAGLFAVNGCADAARVTFYADSDQRTRETGKALAQGLLPGCSISVAALPEDTSDTLFHPRPNSNDAALATAAISGRIAADPAHLTQAYRSQIVLLDHILATCGTPATTHRTSLFDVPAKLDTGSGDHLAELRGPLYIASTLSENLLLEYTEGMPDPGWGCVHHDELETLMQLHTAAVDFTQRTPVIARAQAANLLDTISRSMEQAATGKPVAGAKGAPADLALFLIGHDTNIENIAGALNLTWIIDGRRDDTPPGGALIFELWQERSTQQYSVRVFYTAQTIDQMRAGTPLTSERPPQRVALFVPGCSRINMACSLPDFFQALSTNSR